MCVQFMFISVESLQIAIDVEYYQLRSCTSKCHLFPDCKYVYLL